jgi:hypothetical protein
MATYKPLYEAIFEEYNYSWEDLDLKIYRSILREMGYSKEAIKKEIAFLEDLLCAI